MEIVSFEPELPLPGRTVRVAVEASDPDGDEITTRCEWFLDGVKVGDEEELTLSGARRGDRLEVRVVAHDGQVESLPVTLSAVLGNAPPLVGQVRIVPAEAVTAGETLVAEARGRDREGERVSLAYDWRVNGKSAGAPDLPSFDTSGLSRGARVEVVVTASDGEITGPPSRSPMVRITNRPPRVESQPGTTRLQIGTEFSYRVSARDPDRDRSLQYALDVAPAGMTIGAHDGRIHWKPMARQKGEHSVRVIVDDQNGGVAEHEFDLTVRSAPRT